jgi:hypothetical protein
MKRLVEVEVEVEPPKLKTFATAATSLKRFQLYRSLTSTLT